MCGQQCKHIMCRPCTQDLLLRDPNDTIANYPCPFCPEEMPSLLVVPSGTENNVSDTKDTVVSQSHLDYSSETRPTTYLPHEVKGQSDTNNTEEDAEVAKYMGFNESPSKQDCHPVDPTGTNSPLDPDAISCMKTFYRMVILGSFIT